MNNTKNHLNGKMAGIISCILSVLGILTLGFIFIPISFIVLLVASFFAIKNKDISSIGIVILGWVLLIIGLCTSPILLNMIDNFLKK